MRSRGFLRGCDLLSAIQRAQGDRFLRGVERERRGRVLREEGGGHGHEQRTRRGGEGSTGQRERDAKQREEGSENGRLIVTGRTGIGWRGESIPPESVRIGTYIIPYIRSRRDGRGKKEKGKKSKEKTEEREIVVRSNNNIFYFIIARITQHISC